MRKEAKGDQEARQATTMSAPADPVRNLGRNLRTGDSRTAFKCQASFSARNSVANRGRLVSHSPSAFLHFDDQKRLSRPKITRPAHFQELPISTPVPKTKAPPSATCVAADMIGVSMY